MSSWQKFVNDAPNPDAYGQCERCGLWATLLKVLGRYNWVCRLCADDLRDAA